MYTLKAIARRGALLSSAAVLVAATIAPAVAFADALNPLTERSLTLSSSSPGWSYTDGSGNSTYAPPNSGANGKKTGNTFAFKTSSDSTTSTIKAFTFQYCTQPAGQCRAPGDNTTPGVDTDTTSDLKVVTSSPAEVGGADFSTVVDTASADGAVKAVPGVVNPNNPADTTGQYAAKDVAGNFVVYYYDTNTSAWVQSTGWTMTAKNQEEISSGKTNQQNFITLANSTGAGTPAGTRYKIVFFGTNNNYIQNPGSGAFFVKINTFKAVDLTTPANPVLSENDIIDGGVTVANIMNQSIWIQTKVLETMEFSVGTVDPNTLSSDTTGDTVASELDNAYGAGIGVKKHTVCESILKSMTPSEPANVLKLGAQEAESSLSTQHTYSTHSYWRLSSNSSAGATVYYSGHTLSNTVGDQIEPIGPDKKTPARGAEQFGLALAVADNTAGADEVAGVQQYSTSYAQEATYENGNDNGKTSIHTASLTADGVIANASWHSPRLYPLVPQSNYNSGAGTIDSATPSAWFAFDSTSDTIPVALATENNQVVDCVTGKMRYIANIAATTPAGIYTTKINYIAAPQY